MAVLSWGKPLIEVCAYVNGTMPASPTWTALPVSKENSTKLNTTKGNKTEATGEGGETIDIRYQKSKYALETELFVKKGDSKPITDDDGIVETNYAVRLTPEDDSTEGFIIDKANVSVEEIWTAADGKTWKYTFDALKPATGALLKPYTKGT